MDTYHQNPINVNDYNLFFAPIGHIRYKKTQGVQYDDLGFRCLLFQEQRAFFVLDTFKINHPENKSGKLSLKLNYSLNIAENVDLTEIRNFQLEVEIKDVKVLKNKHQINS